MVRLLKSTPLIYRVAIAVPLYTLFDYRAPTHLTFDCQPGCRLEVPFGRSKKTGFLIEIVQHSTIVPDKLRTILSIIDEQPLLSTQDLELLKWVASYYHHPLGEVINNAFPVGFRQGKTVLEPIVRQYFQLTEQGRTIPTDQLSRSPKQRSFLEKFQQIGCPQSESVLMIWDKNWRICVKALINKQLLETVADVPDLAPPLDLTQSVGLPCNAHQLVAVNAVIGHFGKFGVFLLEGVTGSGKTEVYLQIIRASLMAGQQILVLIPEITLTPQLEARFRQRFSVNIAISHSKLTNKQRQSAWYAMQKGMASIMLGTRSALFTPIKNLGLIILDEEHDVSFKQQDGLRFSARDVAIMRAKLLKIPVLLGSATPSLESLYNADRNRYCKLRLPERAGSALTPVLQILDIRNKTLHEGLSEALINEISKTLAKNEQVLLFLNRRGFAPTLICHSCGWVARCLNCDANLVIHAKDQQLICHHCGQLENLLHFCGHCKKPTLTALGLGTERVEKVLSELYPNHCTVRLDKDSTQRKNALQNYLTRINQGDVDIILGTQMLAKGHHFPNVTLVAVLDVDSGLFSIDFRAPEKLAQLIVQVSGRAGRAEKTGRVILQTRHPEHPLLMTLLQEDYSHFAQMTLAERKQADLPPYSFQALFRASSVNPKIATEFLGAVGKLAAEQANPNTQILGPIPAPMSKRAGQYHYQLLLQCKKRTELHRLLDVLVIKISQLKPSKNVRWSLDVDPIDLY